MQVAEKLDWKGLISSFHNQREQADENLYGTLYVLWVLETVWAGVADA
jgi:hypothetical protein